MSHVGSSSDDPLIGSTLAGRYRIEQRVGAGAMGAVYRAAQTGLGRHVALKVLKRDMAWGGDTVQRFRREAKAMSALNHPNTVRVFDFGATDDGLLFLAMEMLEGEPATDYLQRIGAVDVRDAVLFAQEVLRSIGEAHTKGIVHRDLKPDNIFFARVDGRSLPMVKVLDFGIAKAIEGDRKIDQFETLDGTVFGTPRYMSPEQASGKALDPRSDLYSVGILLYEFLAGQPPFIDADAVVVMAKHIREQPVPLSRAAADRMIPRSIEAIVARALEKDVSKRWQSAEDFDKALEAALPDIERLSRMSFARVQHNVVGSLSSTSKTARIALFTGLGVVLALIGAAALQTSTSSEQPPLAAAASNGVATPSNTQPTADTIAPAPNEPVRTAIVNLRSEPDTAAVSRDGIELGVTPLDVVVPTGTTLSLTLRKDGFADHTLELSASEPSRLVTLTALPAAEPRETREATREASRDTRKPPRTRRGKHSSGSSSSTAVKPNPTPTSPYEKF